MKSEKKEMKPILLVEDEEVMRESVRDWLTDVGYRVATAGDGEEALNSIAEQEFELVIRDLRLPGKAGLEILREARDRQPKLKGVMLTAYPSVETAVEAIKRGAIDYLPKPFDLNHLEEIIRQTLGPVQEAIRPEAAPQRAAADTQPPPGTHHRGGPALRCPPVEHVGRGEDDRQQRRCGPRGVAAEPPRRR